MGFLLGRKVMSLLSWGKALLIVCILQGGIPCLAQRQSELPDPSLNHPDFKPSAPQTKMPKTLLAVKQTEVRRAKYPVIDIHFHGRNLETPEDYRKLLRSMQGRWKIYGVFLPDQVLRNVYYANALKVIPGLEPLLKKRFPLSLP